MNGLLLVDKPTGMTSCEVVEAIKAHFRLKKVGHGGTLDPMATGILVVLIGKATKLFEQIANDVKEYDATLTLGITTDTGDATGKVLVNLWDNGKVTAPNREEVERIFHDFTGTIAQTPPMISALKHRGRRLYELARRGEVVPRRRRFVQIHKLELVDFRLPEASFRIRCSRGTYIRTLCEDIGQRLGCGAHLSRLRRLSSGSYELGQAVTLAALRELSRPWLEEALIKPASIA